MIYLKLITDKNIDYICSLERKETVSHLYKQLNELI